MSYIDDRHKLENMRTGTQKRKILAALLDGQHISELTGLSQGFGTSMRSRISDLRKAGYDISDYRPTNTYKVYHMTEDAIKAVL